MRLLVEVENANSASSHEVDTARAVEASLRDQISILESRPEQIRYLPAPTVFDPTDYDPTDDEPVDHDDPADYEDPTDYADPVDYDDPAEYDDPADYNPPDMDELNILREENDVEDYY